MSEEDKKDWSEIKDITLEILGSASDKQKELILENINKSISEQGGVITLEKTTLHGTFGYRHVGRINFQKNEKR